MPRLSFACQGLETVPRDEDSHCSDQNLSNRERRGSQETAAWVSFAMLLFLTLPSRENLGEAVHKIGSCSVLTSNVTDLFLDNLAETNF